MCIGAEALPEQTRLNSFSPNPREVGLYLLQERVSRESRGEMGQRERKKEKEIERGERHFCCQQSQNPGSENPGSQNTGCQNPGSQNPGSRNLAS